MIPFGKHKGREAVIICEEDPTYMQWFIAKFGSKFPDVANACRDKIDPNAWYMRWGKYKGKTLEFIKQTDPKYFDWLHKSEMALKDNEFKGALIRS